MVVKMVLHRTTSINQKHYHGQKEKKLQSPPIDNTIGTLWVLNAPPHPLIKKSIKHTKRKQVHY